MIGYMLGLGAVFAAGCLSGMVVTWWRFELREQALDLEREALANQAVFLDARHDALTEHMARRAMNDGGFAIDPGALTVPTVWPARVTPSDLPPYDPDIIKYNIVSAVAEAEGLPQPAPALTMATVAASVTVPSASAPKWMEMLTDWVARTIESAPMRLLEWVAVILFHLDRSPAPVRPLNAPMAYVPPAVVRAVASVTNHRVVSARHILTNLRTERGESSEGGVTLTPVGGRHAVAVAPGAATQRERSLAAAQRHEIRTTAIALKARESAYPTMDIRVFDTAEYVTIPEGWCERDAATDA